MAEWFAHSARHGCPSQGYEEHIRNVTRGAVNRARQMLRHYGSNDPQAPTHRTLLEIAADSASHHDFGKLDDKNQAVLAGNSARGLPIRHEDAGVALLSKYGALEAAGLVAAHHRGLPKYTFLNHRHRPGIEAIYKLDGDSFRFHVHKEHPETAVATDKYLDIYRRRHEQAVGNWRGRNGDGSSQCRGFARRLLLSCLVDADHSDTARHYGQAVPKVRIAPRWEERLAALDSYVLALAVKKKSDDPSVQERMALRADLYQACREASTDHRLTRAC